MPSRKSYRNRGKLFRPSNPSFNKHQRDIPGPSTLRPDDATPQDSKIQATRLAHEIDESMGFERYVSGKRRIGWLCNMQSTSIEDDKIPGGRAGVDYYFLEDDGGSFKATVEYDPYFLIAVARSKEAEVEEWCRRKFEGLVKRVIRVEKEDLQMPNHLLGYKRTFLRLTFANVGNLLNVRKVIMPLAESNKKGMSAMDTYVEIANANAGFDLCDDEADQNRRANGISDATEYIVDIREYDVPYHVRVSIDKDIRIGKWYTVEVKHGTTTLTCIEERIQRADPVVLAFDIETTKLPLKFPDAVVDQIMMISYMIDGQGFLITNREIVSEDIADFEYTPKPEYDGPFLVFNEPDEKALVERFFLHIKEARPTVIATFNGDFFDWPFVEARASVIGIDMYREIGYRKNSEDIYQCSYGVHMDCFSWVNRDSYLPQGSRGLKAVTVAKLGYDPDELDPELMTRYASEKPQTLAEYSVSDAVATYYLYMKYIHPFIFSLCNIIPLNPDDVLRKGTGTLCEMLLMVQAYQKGIVLPNKHKEPKETFWEGHLLESETYVGGHVESIEAGIFRSDIPVNFALDTSAIDELLKDLDAALHFSIVVEEKKSRGDITNYEEVKTHIAEKLQNLKANPNRHERPSIYHLDVASMYPNIMTTNRLQPDSMVQESDCAACDFNRPGKTCDRRLPWSWRGEYLPPHKNEYNMVRHALENESFPGRQPNGLVRTFQDLSLEEQASLVKKRLSAYSKRIYHKIHEAKTIEREAIICQRENPFYVDTVRSFRDRRYDFKGKQKLWKNKTEILKDSGASAAEIEEAKKMIVLFDSLQLAHKVILNSFYGYVMRKGSRWYSMEMAGVTCLTGAHIIQMARELIERIGRPLELDTDGIWCMLPATFPENVVFTLKNGKSLPVSYPCIMLNHLVHARFTNNQYQTLVDPQTFKYETHSDNSIFFEVDGPYKAMILPTSKEEDKNLKKRYAVFNHDGSVAELKGFEVKRRGELKLIKIFQTQIFKFFLEGSTLVETYEAVAKVANRWLDVLYQHGMTLADEELIDLICENRSMSKPLEEYGAQKSTSITTAKRLAEFLGAQMVRDKGLNCKYIISSSPKNAPVTERAIPVAIFSASEQIKRYFIRKWTREDPSDMNPRTLIDWDYYLERLGSVVQKLITIPAALQKIHNPVPRVRHPEWLQRRINIKDDKFKQTKMTDLFDKQPLSETSANILNHRLPTDLEDFDDSRVAKAKASQSHQLVQKRKSIEPATQLNVDPYASLPSKMPSPTEDYEGFLRYQKQKWKIQKQQRIHRRQLFGERANVTSDALGGFFRNQMAMLFTNTWQVLQLRESEVLGEIRAYILIDSKVHSITVKVPRQLFLNVKGNDLPDVDIAECVAERVPHTLPNGHPSAHLFRLIMPEEVYVRESQKIAMLLDHPSIEGVYETQLPLHMRAVLQLGSLCTVDESQKGVLGKALEHGFGLSTLKRTSARQPYLVGSEMAFIYLYHLIAGDLQIFVVFSTVRNEARIVIQSKSKDASGLPHAEKMYSELRAQRHNENRGNQRHSLIEYQDRILFKAKQVTTQRKAYLELGDTIKKLQADESKPTVLVIQSSRRKLLMQTVPSLHDFPILSLPVESSDSNLPSLNWQPFVTKRVVTRYLALGSWISHLIELARYGDIPLCNLERSDPGFLIDVAYARRLQKGDVVLWWSGSPQPDHAGYEKDDIQGPVEKIDVPVVNNPGTYSSVCIEVHVQNLAINTVLTSSLVNDIDGTDLINFAPAALSEEDPNGGTGALHSESAVTSVSVKILREMVKAWWTEACRGSSMADIMVQHLVRWVGSRESFLFDRRLHYYVQLVSHKAFQQLVTDFRRLGSHVVFANANRFLLQTTKAEVGNAYAYSQYIVKSIKAKPLFHFLDLDIQEYWDYLVWYDEFNYGGKACQKVVEAEAQTLDTVMHWQLATFLPNQYQPVFHDWIVEFIELMYSLKQPRLPTLSDTFPGSAASYTHIPIHGLTSAKSNEDVDVSNKSALTKAISKPLKRQILALVSRYQSELAHATLAADHQFPDLPGSHLNLSNTHPVLQLAISIMHVFSLDKSVNLEARFLRKELLAFFEIKEFSAPGRFENPSSSLRLNQWICEQCTMARDLDLCRDEDLLPETVAAGGVPRKAWTCTTCRHEYNRLAVEEALIAGVQGMLIEWQTQDVRCGKCKCIRVNEFLEHCGCSGIWVGSVDRETVVTKLSVLDRVAGFYGLRMLKGVVEETIVCV
ncbi:MAG: hypothetical protein LQ342_001324 [Letrouitia transgressa]|nr:MAG: hypothetical protein LQ342_001324 [Letrouitia transgressa]